MGFSLQFVSIRSKFVCNEQLADYVRNSVDVPLLYFLCVSLGRLC
jgi:hypothetical protein